MFNFYTKMGMKISKIHMIYRIKQSLWSEKYINHNTQERSKAKTNFEKEYFDQILERPSKISFKGISQHYNDFSLYKSDKEKQHLINLYT